MTIAAPYALPQGGSSWTLADWRPLRKQTPAAAAAGATVQLAFDTTSADELWLIDHVVVACSSTTATRCRFYENSVTTQNLLDGTDAGNFNAADWAPGLAIFPNTSLVVAWFGASAGAVGSFSAQVRILRKA